MDIQQSISDYIFREFAYTDRTRRPGADDPLLGSEGGTVDSVGLHQLIMFVEKEFGITMDDQDIVPETFQSPRVLAAYVEGKLKQKQG